MTAPTVSAARLAELIADKDAGDSLGPWDRDTLACLRELSSARQEMERLTATNLFLHRTVDAWESGERVTPATKIKLESDERDLTATRQALETAIALGQALADKLEVVRPAIENAFQMAEIHGMPYSGPTYGPELTELRAFLASPEGRTR